MRLLWSYLERHGRPISCYTDKASLFQTTPKIARDCTEVPRDDILWETPSFGEFDALCLSRRIGSGILIQPVIPIIHGIAAKHAMVAPGDYAFRVDVQSGGHFFERQQALLA